MKTFNLQITSVAARRFGLLGLLLASTAAPVSAQPNLTQPVPDVLIAPVEPGPQGNAETLRNSAWVKEFYGAAMQGNFSAVTELLAPNVKETFGSQTTHGPQGVIDNLKAVASAFPNLQMRVTSLIAQDDQIVARWTASGTHRGKFIGIPATNKSATTTGVDIFRLKDGKVVEHQTYIDLVRLFEELQIIKRRN